MGLEYASALNNPKISPNHQPLSVAFTKAVTTSNSSTSQQIIKPQVNESSKSTQQTASSPNSQQQKDPLNNSVVYDDINIFMWSVCKICNKVNLAFVFHPKLILFSY